MSTLLWNFIVRGLGGSTLFRNLIPFSIFPSSWVKALHNPFGVQPICYLVIAEMWYNKPKFKKDFYENPDISKMYNHTFWKTSGITKNSITNVFDFLVGIPKKLQKNSQKGITKNKTIGQNDDNLHGINHRWLISCINTIFWHLSVSINFCPSLQ